MTKEEIISRLESGEAVESIGEDLGLEVEDDIVILPGWIADDGNAEVEYPDADDGSEAASDYVETGDWGEPEETSWVTVWAWQVGLRPVVDDEDGSISVEEVEVNRDSYKIAIEPDEPDCLEGFDHDWRCPVKLVGGIKENPGVWGHGGGVLIAEACTRCGCGKHVDTWAQDMTDGTQGHTSTRYEPGEFDIAEHLGGLDVGNLDREDVADGEGWAVFISEGPWGWWVATSILGDDDPKIADWFPSREAALEEAESLAENLKTHAGAEE